MKFEEPQRVLDSGKTIYSSARMRERRSRILSETRDLIAEGSIHEFSMAELADRCGVAKRTLYNAFRNKDGVVIAAINEGYVTFMERTVFHHPGETTEGAIERLVRIHTRAIDVKSYFRAIVDIYFSSSVDADLRSLLHNMAGDRHRLWLGNLSATGALLAGTDVEKAADRVASLENLIAFDWCHERLTDAEYVASLIADVLRYVSSLVAPRERVAFDQIVDHIQSESPLHLLGIAG